ncbi:hypothetical protein KC336_g5759 [Hortaea werneckii]|nr:hypothetical protein KC336_g5759 [Hortaea werneckii]
MSGQIFRRLRNIPSFREFADTWFVVVQASDFTTTGLKCLLQQTLSAQELGDATRQSLIDAFSVQRAEKGPTLANVDIKFRLLDLPSELQVKIAEFAVYRDRVIGLGNCRGAPYAYMTKPIVPPIAQTSRYLRQISLEAYYKFNTFGTEVRGKDNKQVGDFFSLSDALRCLATEFSQPNVDRVFLSLQLPNIHVHIPIRVQVANNPPVQLDDNLAMEEVNWWVIFSDQGHVGLRDQSLLQDECNVHYVRYHHNHVVDVNEWDTRSMVTRVQVQEQNRTTVNVGLYRNLPNA